MSSQDHRRTGVVRVRRSAALRFGVIATLIVAPVACSSPTSPPAASVETPAVDWAFPIDAAIPVGGEAYQCFRVSGREWAGRALSSVVWTLPPSPPPSPPGSPAPSSVALHHATLMATADAGDAGAFPCEEMPATFSVIHVESPGAGPLSLPPGIAVMVPSDTATFLVETHVLRFAEGPAGTLGLSLVEPEVPPQHLAAWVSIPAGIPVLRPHETTSSFGRCRFDQEATAVLDWPHMHRLGRTFHGRIFRTDGRVDPLIEVPTWRFDLQPMIPVQAAIAPGDVVETECIWDNTTDDFVFGGRLTTDEMCNQGLFVWPPSGAFCAPVEP